MNGKRPIQTVIATSIAILLFAGCSSEQTSSTESQLVDPASPSPTATLVQTEPDQRPVDVVSVTDAVTVVVTPVRTSDELYGTEFTVHLNDVVVPASSECGYEETLAFAQELLPSQEWTLQYGSVTDDVWIDQAGDHHGFLSSNSLSYGQNLVRAGLAHTPKGQPSYMDSLQREAQTAGTGHWKTCTNYGM